MTDDLQGSAAASVAESLRDTTAEEIVRLAEDERAALSKVLFPDTDVREIVILDKPRKLRPLPIKWSKQIHALVKPFQDQVGRAIQDQIAKKADAEDVNEEHILKVLFDIADVLVTYYQWEDVKAALEEEEITLGEVQDLVVRQTTLQADNDFLLTGLRMLVTLMRQAEIRSVRLRSTLAGLF